MYVLKRGSLDRQRCCIKSGSTCGSSNVSFCTGVSIDIIYTDSSFSYSLQLSSSRRPVRIVSHRVRGRAFFHVKGWSSIPCTSLSLSRKHNCLLERVNVSSPLGGIRVVGLHLTEVLTTGVNIVRISDSWAVRPWPSDVCLQTFRPHLRRPSSVEKHCSTAVRRIFPVPR